MSNYESPQERQRIQRQAVFWDWRLRDPNLPETEWHRFGRWHAIAAHREALEIVAGLREKTGREAPAVSPIHTPAHSRGRRFQLPVAAAGLLFLILAILSPTTRPPILQTKATIVAWRLEDGSIVRAAPSTQLEVHYDAGERSLYLLQGQAFFQVAHDPARPFLVRTEVAIAKATGTRFGVSNRNRDSLVTVTEGTVSVTLANLHKDAPRTETLTQINLHADEQVRVSSTSIQVVPVTDSSELSWARTIAFDTVPVIEAVEQYSQMNGLRLTFKDPKTVNAGIVISGAYQVEDAEAFAQTVADLTLAPLLLYRTEADAERIEPQAPPLHIERYMKPVSK